VDIHERDAQIVGADSFDGSGRGATGRLIAGHRLRSGCFRGFRCRAGFALRAVRMRCLRRLRSSDRRADDRAHCDESKRNLQSLHSRDFSVFNAFGTGLLRLQQKGRIRLCAHC
jgi:hypothetical protein